jgi:Zn-dependent protease with chaperone function
MRYLMAAGVGVLTAIAAAVLWIVVAFVLPIAVPLLLSWTRINQAGADAVGASISSGSIAIAALAGFVGGGAWMLWAR